MGTGKKIVSLFLILFTVTHLFTGCGPKQTDTTLEGTWRVIQETQTIIYKGEVNTFPDI